MTFLIQTLKVLQVLTKYFSSISSQDLVMASLGLRLGWVVGQGSLSKCPHMLKTRELTELVITSLLDEDEADLEALRPKQTDQNEQNMLNHQLLIWAQVQQSQRVVLFVCVTDHSPSPHALNEGGVGQVLVTPNPLVFEEFFFIKSLKSAK